MCLETRGQYTCIRTWSKNLYFTSTCTVHVWWLFVRILHRVMNFLLGHLENNGYVIEKKKKGIFAELLISAK